jgi:hypothetical protein
MKLNRADIDLIWSFLKDNTDVQEFEIVKHSETSVGYGIDLQFMLDGVLRVVHIIDNEDF